MHVQQSTNAIKQKGLKDTYKKLVGTKKECASKLKEARLGLEISQGKIKEDSIQAQTVKAATDVHDKAKEAILSVANHVFLLYFNLLSEEANSPRIRSWLNKLTAAHGWIYRE
jgi:hypothetical protein